MPLLDPSLFGEARYNGQDVTAMRLNGKDIWTFDDTPPVEVLYEEHTVFGDDPPLWTVGSYGDNDPSSWLGSNFYTFGEEQAGWEFVGGRIYIQPGSMNLGMPAMMGYYLQYAGGGKIGPSNSATGVIEAIAASASVPVYLHEGWNEVRIGTPLPITWGAGIAVGWQLRSDGTGYQFVNGTDVTSTAGADLPYKSLDGSPIGLSEDLAYEINLPRRGEFGKIGSEGQWAFNGAWYGADVILRKPITI